MAVASTATSEVISLPIHTSQLEMEAANLCIQDIHNSLEKLQKLINIFTDKVEITEKRKQEKHLIRIQKLQLARALLDAKKAQLNELRAETAELMKIEDIEKRQPILKDGEIPQNLNEKENISNKPIIMSGLQSQTRIETASADGTVKLLNINTDGIPGLPNGNDLICHQMLQEFKHNPSTSSSQTQQLSDSFVFPTSSNNKQREDSSQYPSYQLYSNHSHNLLVSLSTFIQSRQSSADLNQLPSALPSTTVFPFNTTWKRSDFECKKRLGKGAYGAVWLMTEKATSKQVAVKEMDYYSKDEKESVIQEIELMIKIHEIIQLSKSSSQFLHIVKPLGFFVDEDYHKAYIVLEYCSKGDLKQYIKNMKESGTMISPEKAYEIVGQIASSLFQLHSNGILHADLKPENVLLVEGFKVKLADFGLARKLRAGRDSITNHGGTFNFRAPEILRNNKISKGARKKLTQTRASDIWALGVIIFQLLAQRHPFFDNESEEDISDEEFIHRVVNLPPAELPEHCPLKLKKLVKQMLEKDPKKRITANQILELPEIVAALSKK
ncbi:MAG: putative AGC family protein kinase [Streblomastix strix]|uniref:Putative AGC family protein kinase n=1 Tax=Streblomastix strix TaxID=222440 RepID=A0A5J4V525_9EUKA|nr:MAG: putative AGC family protein kinase [Streblomastix strix]